MIPNLTDRDLRQTFSAKSELKKISDQLVLRLQKLPLMIGNQRKLLNRFQKLVQDSLQEKGKSEISLPDTLPLLSRFKFFTGCFNMAI